MNEPIIIPGYSYSEYLLVLSPHEDLENRVKEIKEEFAETYRAPLARTGRPHITLVRFMQYDMMEERLLHRLRHVARLQSPFKIELKDFGSFPSHTIYINIATKVPLQDLVKAIRQETQRLMKLNEEHKPHFIMEPHLTIARKLQPWQYEKGWLAYSHRSFTGRFIAEGMQLLKRPPGQGRYHAIARFGFESQQVQTMQGDLFG